MKNKNLGFMPEVGVGVDIESLQRFQKLNLTHDKTFLQRIYTPKELSYCFAKKYPAQHLAVRFTAKEAVLKALSVLGTTKLPLNTIEIYNDKKGIPYVNLIATKSEKFCLKISLSHDKDKALAFALAFRSR